MQVIHAIRWFHFTAMLVVALVSCSKTEIRKPLEYEGPMREAENIEMFYTENDLIKVKMQAALLYEFQNGDQEFPKGIYLEFYDETGRLESTLRANNAYFFKEQDQWRAQGKVEVKNLITTSLIRADILRSKNNVIERCSTAL